MSELLDDGPDDTDIDYPDATECEPGDDVPAVDVPLDDDDDEDES